MLQSRYIRILGWCCIACGAFTQPSIRSSGKEPEYEAYQCWLRVGLDCRFQWESEMRTFTKCEVVLLCRALATHRMQQRSG